MFKSVLKAEIKSTDVENGRKAVLMMHCNAHKSSLKLFELNFQVMVLYISSYYSLMYVCITY